jgi:hypothetical protein
MEGKNKLLVTKSIASRSILKVPKEKEKRFNCVVGQYYMSTKCQHAKTLE